MSLLDELHPGSYKGVSFLIASSSIAGGRKDVQHNYPNSNKQTIEDLGLKPRVFTVAAIINADRENNNYIQRRDRFLSILEQGGPGTLVHPLYGQIDNVVARNFTLIEDLTELGDGKINITFTVSDDLGVPVKSQNTLSVIENSFNGTIDAINSDVANNFSVNTFNLNSFSDAVGTLNDMVTEFNTNTNFLQATADQIDTFSRELTEFQTNITSLVRGPQALADSITTLFNVVGNMYPTFEATADVLAGFFDFDDNKTPRTENTASRIERNRNDNIMKAAMQNVSLSHAYFTTSQIDFETVTDIESRADDLEIQFQKAIAADGLQPETKDTMKTLRDDVQQFFDDQKLTARQLINVNTSLTSTRLLSHQYYGNSDEGERIADINNTDDVTFIEGNVQILTA